MASRKTVPVELSEYLSDQPPIALKILSAPIAHRIERFLLVLREARQLGSVPPAELISALVHAQQPDLRDLEAKVVAYRNAEVWQTRESLGDVTETTGTWRIRVRGPGERWG